jgi:2-hydroxy-6-oxonona-2,4-dienedioate hydrolase
MVQGTSGYAELEDGKLYYEVAGDGEPLVLSHAGFVDSRMWDDQWNDFAQRYSVIRFDMRGFGKSGRAEKPVARRDDLYHLLKHLGIERTALLGCSMSGEIVLDFTLEHPEMVSTLIVVSAVPSGFEMRGEPPQQLMEMMAAVEQGDLALASELQNRIWIDGPFRQPDQVDPGVRKRAAEMNRIGLANDTFRKVDASPLNPLNPPAAQRLNEVHIPTLIIAGGLDDPEILRAADVMEAAISRASKVIMPECAHMPNMEQPEKFNQVVLDFLQNAHATN